MNPVAGMKRGAGFVIPAFVLTLFCSAELQAQQQGETKITAVRNQVTRIAEGTNTPTDVGHALKTGEVVETGEQGLVELKSTDATTVRIGEKSRAAYDSDGRTLKLDRGVVVVDAPSDGGAVKIDLGGVTYTVTTEGKDGTKESQTQNTDSQKKIHHSKSNSVVLQNREAANSK